MDKSRYFIPKSPDGYLITFMLQISIGVGFSFLIFNLPISLLSIFSLICLDVFITIRICSYILNTWFRFHEIYIDYCCIFEPKKRTKENWEVFKKIRSHD